MTTLPAFSIFGLKDPPHRHRVQAEHRRLNGHGVEMVYKVVSNWPETVWWATCVFRGFRASPGMRTTSARKAEQWIADVKAGRVIVAEREL